MGIKTAAFLKKENRDFNNILDSQVTRITRVRTITANTELTQDDCGTTILVDPASTTLITLPTIASVDTGWNVRVILHEGAAGADEGMGQKVNFDLGSGTNLANVGKIIGSDGDAGDLAVANDDFIACAADASPGDRFDFFSDGNRWFIEGFVQDASECPFATAAG